MIAHVMFSWRIFVNLVYGFGFKFRWNWYFLEIVSCMRWICLLLHNDMKNLDDACVPFYAISL